MTYQPTHLATSEEHRIDAIQQARVNGWRTNEQWRLALARAHREQEIRLQRSYIETVRAA